MARSGGPRRRGPPRIAATIPSIMPLGATMSAPAARVAHRDAAEDLQRGVVVHACRRGARRSGRGWCIRSSRRRSGGAGRDAARAAAGAPAGRCRRRRSSPRRSRPWPRAARTAARRECRAPRRDPTSRSSDVVHREVTHAGHRGDLALDLGAVDHEDRLDEVAGLELVLADEAAQGLGSAPAAGTMDLGVGHEGKTRERGHRRNRGGASVGTRHDVCRVTSAGGRGHARRHSLLNHAR